MTNVYHHLMLQDIGGKTLQGKCCWFETEKVQMIVYPQIPYMGLGVCADILNVIYLSATAHVHDDGGRKGSRKMALCDWKSKWDNANTGITLKAELWVLLWLIKFVVKFCPFIVQKTQLELGQWMWKVAFPPTKKKKHNVDTEKNWTTLKRVIKAQQAQLAISLTQSTWS